MTGWEKCEQLKKIRKAIADANDIPYEIEECAHLEDCVGTCPKCDREAEYINRALNYRAQAGKEIIVDGLLGDLFQGDGGVEAKKHTHVDRKVERSRVRGDRVEYPSKGGIGTVDIVDGGIDDSDTLDFEEDNAVEQYNGADGGCELLGDLVDDELPFN